MDQCVVDIGAPPLEMFDILENVRSYKMCIETLVILVLPPAYRTCDVDKRVGANVFSVMGVFALIDRRIYANVVDFE
jgi:hypothetical protein